MNMNKVVTSLVLASAGMFGVGSAQAAVAYGPVEQYYTNGATTYVYVSPANYFGVPPYLWYCATTDPDLSYAITSSLHKNVYISCINPWPAGGTLRYGGTLSWIYAN
ncbi:hypothetical protein [Thiocystis minor]|uniref:hypothetical protein n=1 Tax=Thiocystis minor TaxID=61597 RepID=UPI0019135FD9|nr:hypothetical protein [Thiocystis minor]